MKKTAKKYFIPHEENEYKPHFFREKSVVALALIIAFLFVFSLFQGVLIRQGNLASVVSSVLVDLTNGNRQADNVSSLTVNPLLVEAAQMKANDMAQKGYFAHESPDGLTPWYWFTRAGYRFAYAGENLAINFSDSENVENAWMNSPGHRANILNPNFTEIGIATAKGMYEGRETVFVVQMFGSPASAAKREPTNTSNVSVSENKEASSSVSSVAGAEKTGDDVQTVADENNFVAVKSVDYAPFRDELVASPGKTLSYFYLILGGLIALALFAFIFIEVKKQHPKNILYACLLIIFMAGLLYVSHSFVFSGVIIK